MTNRLDHVYFSEPLENRHSVFKKYGMRHLVNTNTFFHTIFVYSKIQYTFFDPKIRNWGSSNSVHPILCVCRTVVGYFDACSELSWLMCQKFSTTAGYHDVCGGRLMFLIFFS